MPLSRDARCVLDAFTGMSSDRRVRLLEEFPEVYHAILGLRQETDRVILEAQRQFRRDAIRLKIGRLQEDGAHVPEWMIHEAGARI